MLGKKQKIWYACSSTRYTGDCPPYFNLHDKDWYRDLNNNIPHIRSKVLELLEVQYSDLRTYFAPKYVQGGKWEARGFLTWGLKDKLLESEKGREVFAYFKDIPGLVLLSLSVLHPGTYIKPHNGETDGAYRLHIPIYIPSGLPECGIKVGGIDRAWKENEVLSFSDANVHEAWNNSSENRVVLIADVVREPFIDRAQEICINVMSVLMQYKLMATLKIPVTPRSVCLLSHLFIPILRIAFRIWYFKKGFYIGGKA